VIERVNVRGDKYLRGLAVPRSQGNTLVQILVTVAITQIEKLRIEVEKGFKCTMFELESVDPNVSIRT